jgi:stage III sporulation protein AH
MVVLLAVSGYLNYALNNRPPADDPNDYAPTFFANFRSERAALRNEEIMYWDAVISSPSSSASARAAAEASRNEIITNMGTETLLEQLIRGRGFEDVAVSATSTNVTIMVLDDDLTAAKVAQILNTVLTNTEYTITQVIVYPYSV